MARLSTAKVTGRGDQILQALATGALPDTDIAVAGLSWRKKPRFFGALRFDGSGALQVGTPDFLSDIKRGTTDGTIQLETTDTSGGQRVLLSWVQER